MLIDRIQGMLLPIAKVVGDPSDVSEAGVMRVGAGIGPEEDHARCRFDAHDVGQGLVLDLRDQADPAHYQFGQDSVDVGRTWSSSEEATAVTASLPDGDYGLRDLFEEPGQVASAWLRVIAPFAAS